MNLEKWLYLASWVVWTAFMFLPAMHERYDYAAIILISAFTWMHRKDSNMKILIVNKFLYPNGGSETYIFGIGEQLRKMGHEVQYFGMEHEGRIVGNHADSYTEPIDFHERRLRTLAYPFKIIYSKEARQKIRVVLEDFHPDVVHLNNINFQLTPSVIDEVKAFDPSIRIVYTAHDMQWVCPNHMMRVPATGELCRKCLDGDFRFCTQQRCIHNSRLRSLIGQKEAEFYRKRHTYRQVDTIICPSNFIRRLLETNPDLNGRCVTLHNFANLNPDRTRGDVLPELLRGIGPYVLYYGRYDQEKGVNLVLEAAKRLPEIPFVLAGKGELQEQVEAAAGAGKEQTLINLGFLGGEPLYSVIRHAAFTVFPSTWYENYPYSVLEPILLGVPVIGSRIGGVPEIIKEGVTGDLFEAGNCRELTEKINALWKDRDRQEQYRGNCLEEHFDTPEEYCGELVKIYQLEYKL